MGSGEERRPATTVEEGRKREKKVMVEVVWRRERRQRRRDDGLFLGTFSRCLQSQEKIQKHGRKGGDRFRGKREEGSKRGESSTK